MSLTRIHLGEIDVVGLRRRLLAGAPWLLVIIALAAGLWWSGTPVLDMARYGAYWVGALLVPGRDDPVWM